MEKDTLASTRQQDDDALVGRLHISLTTSASTAATDDHGQSAAVSVLVTQGCVQSAATELLGRQHDEEVGLQLLDLPDTLLRLLARLMGKRARLLCCKLCQMYGPPGAVLTLSAPMPTPWANAAAPPTYTSVLQSWPHPVRLLVLSSGICFDGPLSALVAAALPHLLELKCDHLDLGKGPPHGAPHTALISLDFKQDMKLGPHTLYSAPDIAPRLRLLRISYQPARGWDCAPHSFVPSGDALWRALAGLRGLQSADVPVRLVSSALYTDVQALSALTHLGLDVMNAWTYPSAASLMRLTGALAALPALASVRLADFPALGASLGAALQALPALRSVELSSNRDVGFASGHDLPAACLPDIGAMPRLKRLTLVGRGVFSDEAPLWAGSTAGAFLPLRSLELGAASAQQLTAACALASACSALTRLVLYVLDAPSAARGGDWAAAGPHVGLALSRNPRLAHLEVYWGWGGCMPCLAGLRSLTYLALEGRNPARGIKPCDVAMVGALTSLRRLVLLGAEDQPACIAAVGKLPQLEDLALWGVGWFHGDGRLLQLLLPPPQRLTRVVLGTSPWDASEWQPPRCDARNGSWDAVEQLARYDVAVVQSSSLSDWRSLANLARQQKV